MALTLSFHPPSEFRKFQSSMQCHRDLPVTVPSRQFSPIPREMATGRVCSASSGWLLAFSARGNSTSVPQVLYGQLHSGFIVSLGSMPSHSQDGCLLTSSCIGRNLSFFLYCLQSHSTLFLPSSHYLLLSKCLRKRDAKALTSGLKRRKENYRMKKLF